MGGECNGPDICDGDGHGDSRGCDIGTSASESSIPVLAEETFIGLQKSNALGVALAQSGSRERDRDRDLAHVGLEESELRGLKDHPELAGREAAPQEN